MVGERLKNERGADRVSDNKRAARKQSEGEGKTARDQKERQMK